MSYGRQLVTAAVVLSMSSAAQADTIYVDAANCPGPGNGSVGDPYCSIQDAIDDAVDTDEVVVAPGTYFENINFLGKAIRSRKSVSLYRYEGAPVSPVYPRRAQVHMKGGGGPRARGCR